MKKSLSILLSLLAILSLLSLGALAEEISSPILIDKKVQAASGDYTYTVTDGNATITDVATSISGSIAVPDSLDGYPVTEIGANAFFKCAKLESIVLPEGITSIKYGAFGDCKSLISITIPASVDAIGAFIFSNCPMLESITVAAGNKTYHSDGSCIIETASKTLVTGCKASVIPTDGSVTAIGSHAFDSYTGFTCITIPDSVTTIGSDAFYNCGDLESVFLGASVETIEDGAFTFCKNLTKIALPKSLSVVGKGAFSTCAKLKIVYYTGTQKDRNNISIGSSNGSLTNATWFYGYCGVNRCTYTADCDAFCNVCFIERANPPSVHSFDEKAQLCKLCGSHQYLRFAANSDGSLAVSGCDPDAEVEIIVPETIESKTITAIGAYAFENCEALTSISLPDSVTAIEEFAFYGCRGLTKLSLGSSVKTIGKHAFSFCSSMTSLILPDSITFIDECAFNGCASLKNSVLPKSVKSVSGYLFYNCTSLQSVLIPKSVTSIGVNAFYGCEALGEIRYLGTAETQKSITKAVGNDPLLSATWHYVDGVCDTVCNECGKACSFVHLYDDDCDEICKLCSQARKAPHVFDGGEDLICNECGYERPPFVLGELDQNDGVTSSDAIYLLYYTLFGEARYPVNQPVDYNKDEILNSADAIYLLYHTLFGSTRYPLE